MGAKHVSYKSAALLALAAAVSAGVPFRDEAGHEYLPCGPGPKVPPGRPHRDGTFTRTGAVPRRRHAFIRAQAAKQREWDKILANDLAASAARTAAIARAEGGAR